MLPVLEAARGREATVKPALPVLEAGAVLGPRMAANGGALDTGTAVAPWPMAVRVVGAEERLLTACPGIGEVPNRGEFGTEGRGTVREAKSGFGTANLGDKPLCSELDKGTDGSELDKTADGSELVEMFELAGLGFRESR